MGMHYMFLSDPKQKHTTDVLDMKTVSPPTWGVSANKFGITLQAGLET